MTDILTTYSDGRGNTYQAVQLSWDRVHEILGRDHDGSAEDDARLIETLRKMGAPEWIDGAEGWIDEYGWGIIGPDIVDAEPCPSCRSSSDGHFDIDRGTWTVYRGGWITCPDCKGTGISV